MARGLMVYPMGGTIDGTRGDHVLLAPPFIVTEDQVGEIVDRLGSAIDDALAWRRGQIVFDGVPLRDALARFARYHGRGITAAPAVADLRVGGRYSLDDLDAFLGALEAVWPVRATRGLSGTIQVGPVPKPVAPPERGHN